MASKHYSSELESEDSCCTVLLEGLKEGCDVVKIQCYLENKKKSNGGPVQSTEACKRGFLVEFENTKDAQAVVQKGNHKIAGCIVKASWFKDLPHYKNRIYVVNIPDSVDKESLEDYFEGKSDCEVDKIQYGEDTSVAVLTFNEDIDFEQLRKSVAKRPLSTVSIEQVELSKVVKVVNIKEGISEETLENYFENTRRSGGDTVSHIELHDNFALIYFEDHEVIENVCQRQHKIQKQEILVDVYHECLGLHGGSTDPNFIKIPDSISLSETTVPPMFLKLIQTQSMVREEFQKMLKTMEACLNKTTDKFEICFESENPDAKLEREAMRAWPSKIRSAVESFVGTRMKEHLVTIKGCEKIKIDEMLKNKLEEQNMKYESVVYHFTDDNVTLYGTTDAVELLIKSINLEKEIQNRAKHLETKNFPLKEHQIKFLRQTGNLNLVKEKFPLLSCTEEGNKLVVNGLKDEVSTVTAMIEQVTSGLQSFSSNLSDNQQKLLRLQDEDSIYHDLTQKCGAVKCIWTLEGNNMVFYSNSAEDHKDASQLLKDMLHEKTIPIESNKQLVLQSDTWKETFDTIQKAYTHEVLLSVSEDGTSLILTVVKDLMDKISKQIDSVFTDVKVKTKSIEFPRATSKDYFQESGLKDIEHAEAKFNIKMDWIDDKLVLTGIEDACILRAEEYIMQVMSQHKEAVLYFKEPGVEKCLLSAFDNLDLTVEGTVASVEGLDIDIHKDFEFVCNETMNGTKTNLILVVGSPQYLHADTVLIPLQSNSQPMGAGGKIGVKEGPGINDTPHSHKSLPGETKITEPGRFYSKSLVYGVYPDANTNGPATYIDVIVEDTLKHAEEKEYQSVALPCIDSKSANLRRISNKTTLETVEKYLTRQSSRLQIIYFYIESKEAAKNFENLIKEQNSQNTRKLKTRYRKKAATTQTNTIPEKKKTTRMFLVTSDITMEEANVVVNSTNSELELGIGAISSALLNRCGQELQEQCKTDYPQGIKQGEIAVTNAFKMASKKVYHCCLPGYEADPSLEVLKSTILKCLKQATKDKIMNIAFPAIGTGILKYPHDKVATVLFETVDKFGEENPNTTLTDVIFVMFRNDEKVIEAFEKKESEYKAKYGTSKVYNRDDLMRNLIEGDSKEDNMEEDINDKVPLSIYSKPSAALVKIYATTEQQLNKLVDKCRHVIKDKITKKTVRRSDMTELDDDQVEEIMNIIAKSDDFGCDIHVEIDRNHGNYKVKGKQQDVASINVIIEQYLREQVILEKEAAHLQFTVQWYFSETTDVGEQLRKYDSVRNFKIEKAYRSDKRSEKIKDDDGEEYCIDFIHMKEKRIQSNGSDDGIAILRKTPLKDANLEPPMEWSDMTGKTMHVDTLKPSGIEYKRVEETFSKELGVAGITIIKIERIQNIGLYQQYTAMKKQMESELKADTMTIERQLFHGTNIDSAKGINRDGFNRSYCGTVSQYGYGVYFAKESAYSVRGDYATKDKDGQKYVYLADVLIGKYTDKQDKSKKYPPYIDETKKTLRYNCVVDQINNPRVFAIFNDNQAYPKYLITFKD